MNKYLFSILMVLPMSTFCQVTLDSTLLPIIIIDTNDGTIEDEPKILATMGIIDNAAGNYNYVTDPFNDYDGNIGIEIRGSSSQFFDKKNYGIELWKTFQQDTSVSLLGMPREEDWVLHGPYSDKSLMRNALTFHLWSKTERYGSRTRYVELVLNNGYKGVYILMEKIKRDKNRVDVSKLTSEENSGDDLTGGYIVKVDKFDGTNSNEGWSSPFDPPGKSEEYQEIYFQFDYPKGRNITNQQRSYIQQSVTDFENVLASPSFRDPVTGYQSLADMGSFVDFAIINEITRNVDGYRLSTFLHKDKNSVDSKLYIGPIWDFNLAIGNADYCNGSNISGWAWDFNEICDGDFWLIPFWWKRFLRDPAFVQQLQNRWENLREGPFATQVVHDYIDSLALTLEDPQTRNFQRWDILGRYIWPNNFIGATYESEINYLKDWIEDRMNWLDQNIAALEVITALDHSSLSDVSIYPNPVKGYLHISNTSRVRSIKLIDINGKILRSFQNENRNQDVDIDVVNLKMGVYFVTLEFNNGSLKTTKIIK